MTNEELAIAIQEGRAGYTELWEQVHDLIAMLAVKSYTVHEFSCICAGVCVDDLMQCGFFALKDAVKAFMPDGTYKFTSYLNYPLKNHFNTAIGIRTKKIVTLNHSGSLDAPVGEETEGITLGDTIPDESAAEDMEQIIERVYQDNMRNAVENALTTLNDQQREVIRCRFYQSMTAAETAEALEMPDTRIRTIEKSAISTLRRSRARQLLEPFRDEMRSHHAWHGTGLLAFKYSCASSVERAAEATERDMQRLIETFEQSLAISESARASFALKSKEIS